ncbi:hypothetical protein HYW75_03685 [Candidatus Pacearchaeota archaeon]|nr:hypothetical protein [Candidatus Pacearchaeota archaeon]
MNKIKSAIVLGIATLTIAKQPLQAAEPILEEHVKTKPKFSVGADLGFSTKYMLKGFTLSETPVMQPTPYVKYGPFTATGIFNYDTRTTSFNEADAFFDITLPLKPLTKKLSLSTGYNFLTFPNTRFHHTHEIYSAISYDTLSKPSLRVIRDISQGSGYYTELSIKHDLPISKSISISGNALIAHNHHLNIDSSGLSHATIGLATPFSIGKGFSITPNINYQYSLNRDFQNELWGGVIFSYFH